MYIMWSSTPRILNGLLWQLEHEDPSMYYKMVLPYQYGLEGPKPIYDLNQLNQAKLSPEWAREYECKYESSYGGVISPMAVDRCLQLGEEMAKTTPIDDWSIQTQYVMSIDMGYGSSNTAIILSRFVNGKVQIIYSKEFTHVDFRDLIDTIWNLRNKYPPKPDGLQNIIIDASGAELYTVLCHECGQNPSPKYLAEKQTWCKKINMPLESQLFVVPVPFSTRHQDLLGHLKWIIEEQDEEDGKAMVAIDKRFEEIVTSLRTAQATENSLDKNATAFDDTLDSLRLNLSYYRRSG